MKLCRYLDAYGQRRIGLLDPGNLIRDLTSAGLDRLTPLLESDTGLADLAEALTRVGLAVDAVVDRFAFLETVRAHVGDAWLGAYGGTDYAVNWVCERMTVALESVGLYVPAGTAPLPSTALMLAVPAKIAGCPVRVMCTPPRPDGSADPAVLNGKKLLVAWGLDFDAVSYPSFDLRERAQVERAITPRHATVINCAAYTDVDGCEANEAHALRVNGEERTVEVHLTAVFLRAKCKSRTELIATVWAA